MTISPPRLAQAILISHLDMIRAVLDHLGIPHEDGFFAKDAEIAEVSEGRLAAGDLGKFHAPTPLRRCYSISIISPGKSPRPRTCFRLPLNGGEPMKELFEAVRAGDLARVQALVDADPSLAIFAAAMQGETARDRGTAGGESFSGFRCQRGRLDAVASGRVFRAEATPRGCC